MEDPAPGLLTLDPEGDATLEVGEAPARRRFLVSSKALKLASPYFARLFGPHFSEGEQIQRSGCAHVPLPEDDPAALETILRTLHYQEPEGMEQVSTKQLVVLALHCDKYLCSKALGHFLARCFEHALKHAVVADYTSVLLAACLLGLPKYVTEISIKCQCNMSLQAPLSWKDDETLKVFPEDMLDGILGEEALISGSTRRGLLAFCLRAAERLRAEIELLVHKIHEEVQMTESQIRNISKLIYRRSTLYCACCGRALPSVTKKCHPCRNKDLLPSYCTPYSRSGTYLAALEHASLWPSLEPFEKLSASEIEQRMSLVSSFVESHECAAAPTCSLQRNVETLRARIRMILNRAEGICLD